MCAVAYSKQSLSTKRSNRTSNAIEQQCYGFIITAKYVKRRQNVNDSQFECTMYYTVLNLHMSSTTR